MCKSILKIFYKYECKCLKVLILCNQNKSNVHAPRVLKSNRVVKIVFPYLCCFKILKIVSCFIQIIRTITVSFFSI